MVGWTTCVIPACKLEENKKHNSNFGLKGTPHCR